MKKAIATPPGQSTKYIDLTQDEIKQREKDEAKKPDYRNIRKQQYPPIGDQLDAIWKEFNYRRMQGDALTQDADNVLNSILAVKKNNPCGG